MAYPGTLQESCREHPVFHINSKVTQHKCPCVVRLQHKRFQTLLQLSLQYMWVYSAQSQSLALLMEQSLLLPRQVLVWGQSPRTAFGGLGSKGSWVLEIAALPQHLHGWVAKGVRDV